MPKVGEINYNNQGLKMTIIEYRRYEDIDIQFEDGTIIYNKQYGHFKRGNIKNPNYKDTQTIDRTGEIGYNGQNEKMTIIKYKKYNNIDVQFEDGVIVYNKTYGAFKKGKISHPIRYEESFAYHIEVELGKNLNDIWNWEKNNENGINPYEIKKQSNKKVWLYCQEYDYHNYDRENNKIGYEIICSSFTSRNYRCPYCHSMKIHYKDSLAYNYPNTAKMISISENNLNFEDCYKIACYSNKKFYFKCLDCNRVSTHKKILSNIVKKSYSCEFCSDGISIPNKFMNNLLNQLNINFKYEYSPYYFRNHQSVDFLLIDYNIIIEMDGGYGNHTREYDYWRDFLNMKYGGYKTIRIDLKDDNRYRKDTFNYIKEQIIKSELFNIFNLVDVDWALIWEQTQKSKCVKAWELWNSGIKNTKDIGNILNLSLPTTIEYLKRGNECKKCDYVIYKRSKK